MYLLDTDTVIYTFKGHPGIQKNLQRHLDDPIKISIVTCMELYYGAYKSQKVAGQPGKNQDARAVHRGDSTWTRVCRNFRDA